MKGVYVERAEHHLKLAQQTSEPSWATAHAIISLVFLLKEYLSGRP